MKNRNLKLCLCERYDAEFYQSKEYRVQSFLGEGIAQPGAVAHGIQLVQDHIVAYLGWGYINYG